MTGLLLSGAGTTLASIHGRQVHRAPWPRFELFEVARYAPDLRRRAAIQWMRRARQEHGSVLEFSRVAAGLCEARVAVEILGGLSRLITDEVRHAEMCARMAVACYPEGVEAEPALFAWEAPSLPWPEPPRLDPATGDREPLLRWAAEAVLTSCCIGETLSRPLFEAAATVTTDPVCEAVLRQILRDEHLHAAFGWATLEALLGELGEASRAWLEERLARRLAGFERSCAATVSLTDLAGTQVEIAPGDPERPNLAMLTPHQYAMVFYATVEAEILPRFEALGLDATGAWARRA